MCRFWQKVQKILADFPRGSRARERSSSIDPAKSASRQMSAAHLMADALIGKWTRSCENHTQPGVAVPLGRSVLRPYMAAGRAGKVIGPADHGAQGAESGG